MTFTNYFLQKKTPHDIHNIVTSRNYSQSEEAEFINDIQSSDLLNGRRR